MTCYNLEGILLTKMAKTLGMGKTTRRPSFSLLAFRKMISIATGGDKGEWMITITKKGIALLESTLPHWEKAQKEVVEEVGPKE
jgi:hypothetical protein